MEISKEDVEVVDENQEIIIENFIGDPKDITIEEGTTVKWANMMYFKHIIINSGTTLCIGFNCKLMLDCSVKLITKKLVMALLFARMDLKQPRSVQINF